MSDELIIRQATPEDAEKLSQFYQLIKDYPNIEAPDKNVPLADLELSLARIYDSLFDNLVVAINDDQIIGFCSVDHGELGIVVDKEFWRFGVGSELMIDTIDWFQRLSSLEALWLEVVSINKAAIKLYEKFDFEVIEQNEKTIKMELKKDD
ncbi:GNAT family N-acetyltransferase [Lactobacillus sp. YT155]|uniref:GNAT family N-acetyltransferase n=1 Tax=Lactobacillus sp. YT155 TaxID=3060955 RepID=UPI00265E5957|nr:GNAT family N-acetyltransferase [Lactobacillus sp. YT155]MDO1605071.1 GNAT family N-acetyltransferase [Lactobacillus sp. YT155]